MILFCFVWLEGLIVRVCTYHSAGGGGAKFVHRISASVGSRLQWKQGSCISKKHDDNYEKTVLYIKYAHHPKSGIVQPKCQIVAKISTRSVHSVFFDGDHFIEVCDDAAENIFEWNFVAASCHLTLKFYRFSQIRHYGQGTGGNLLGGGEAHFLVLKCFRGIIMDIFSLPFYAMAPLFLQKIQKRN